VLQRAQEAILGLSSPPATNKNMALGNNPHKALTQDDDDKETSPVESLEMNQELGSLPRGADLDNASSLASEKTDDTVSTSSMTIFFQEKVLLSRKAQQALRKLKLARKALTDSSISPEEAANEDKKRVDSEKVTNESTGDDKTTKKTCNNAAPSDTVPQTNGWPGTSLNKGKKRTGIFENHSRNVSFAAAVKPPTNSHSLRQGNLE
jgi:hypothetical protein